MYSLFPCSTICFRILGSVCMTQWTVGLSLGPVLNLGIIMSSPSMESSSKFCCMILSFSSFAVSELSTSYIIIRGFLFFGSSILSEVSFGWSLNFCKSLRVSNSIIIEFALVCLIPFIFILSVFGFILFTNSFFISFDVFSLLLLYTRRTCFFDALLVVRCTCLELLATLAYVGVLRISSFSAFTALCSPALLPSSLISLFCIFCILFCICVIRCIISSVF